MAALDPGSTRRGVVRVAKPARNDRIRAAAATRWDSIARCARPERAMTRGRSCAAFQKTSRSFGDVIEANVLRHRDRGESQEPVGVPSVLGCLGLEPNPAIARHRLTMIDLAQRDSAWYPVGELIALRVAEVPDQVVSSPPDGQGRDDDRPATLDGGNLG